MKLILNICNINQDDIYLIKIQGISELCQIKATVMHICSIIIKVKYIINPKTPILYYFSSANAKKLLIQLKEQLSSGGISKKQNHYKIVSLLKQDTNEIQSRYGKYIQIKTLVEGYLKQMGNQKNISRYNPVTIHEQGNRLSQIMFYIATYPKFQLDKEYLRLTYQIFCRQLQHRTDEELNRALLFILKVDERAEQSVIYRQFLKFYLREKWETLKAKYQLNLRNQSIGSMVTKIASSMIHRGFLRRTLDYDKQIQLIFPCQVMEGLLQNRSTSESLMIRKVMYQQLFMPLVERYEKQLRSNLYNDKNTQLWQQINKYCNIIFHNNKYVEKQCKYLRQFYITIYLVLRQQNKILLILQYIQQIIYGYLYAKQYYIESLKSKQFITNLQLLINKQIIGNKQYINYIIQHVKLNKYIFLLMKQIPLLKIQIINKITKQVSPLTFFIYFDNFIGIMENWTSLFVKKISNNIQGNFFNLLTQKQWLDFVNKVQGCRKVNQDINQYKQLIYNQILEQIINKDYKIEPSLTQVTLFLDIYSLHQQLQITTTEHSNLQKLRIFLFRYISDNIQNTNIQQLQHVMAVLIKLNDKRYFGDGQGNYQFNIFQEIGQYVIQSSVHQNFKSIIKEKIKGSKKEGQCKNSDDKSQLIKNMIKKIMK